MRYNSSTILGHREVSMDCGALVYTKGIFIMSLLNCPDCNHEVSDAAPACPNCGRPMGPESDAVGTQLTTTQETAKKFKLQGILSVLTFAVGSTWLYVVFNRPPTEGPNSDTVIPVVLIFVSMIWYIVNRIRAWWHHG